MSSLPEEPAIYTLFPSAHHLAVSHVPANQSEHFVFQQIPHAHRFGEGAASRCCGGVDRCVLNNSVWCTNSNVQYETKCTNCIPKQREEKKLRKLTVFSFGYLRLGKKPERTQKNKLSEVRVYTETAKKKKKSTRHEDCSAGFVEFGGFAGENKSVN
jgi:hypothetical protein